MFRVSIAALMFDCEVKVSDMVTKGQALIVDPNILDEPIDIMLDYGERKEKANV